MTETPKEVFIEEFMKLVKKFESDTGVEVHDISVDRRSIRETRDIGIPTIITAVRMNLK